MHDAEYLENLDELEYTWRYHPSYTLVYKTLRRIYAEQRRIIETGKDLNLVSLAFQRLPKLTELSLVFCDTLVQLDWVKSYLVLDMTMEEKSYEHHIQVLLAAMNSAKVCGVSIQTMQLAGLSLPYDDPWCTRDTHLLATILIQLVEHVSRLQLIGSHSAFELLSHAKLNIHQLDLCSIYVTRDSVENFLRTNAKSIHTLSVQGAKVTRHNRLGYTNLVPADIRKMIGTRIPQREVLPPI